MELEYPLGYLRRRVSPVGAIRLQSIPISVSTALVGWDVGLQPEKDRYGLWFCRLRLGEVDLQTQKFYAITKRQQKAEV